MNNSVLMYNKSQFMHLDELCACVFQVDALRLRLEEKDATLNKKSKQIQEVSEEKGTLNGEIHDLKDMLDVKERKVNVLQKKVNDRHCSKMVCCLKSNRSQ